MRKPEEWGDGARVEAYLGADADAGAAAGAAAAVGELSTSLLPR